MCLAEYRIAGKIGEDFNLAVWRMVKNRLIKFSPIIKHDAVWIITILLDSDKCQTNRKVSRPLA